MPVTYVNRYRDTYYLHAGKTEARLLPFFGVFRR